MHHSLSFTGADYSSINLSLTFQPGENEACTIILIANDLELEGDETFSVNIQMDDNPLLVFTDPTSATVTIVDDELSKLISLLGSKRKQ